MNRRDYLPLRYFTLRLTLTIHVRDLLPDAPSSLKALGAKNFAGRVQTSLNNLPVLPEDHPVGVTFVPQLERELSEYTAADEAEDRVRAGLSMFVLGLTLYQSELSQIRDALARGHPSGPPRPVQDATVHLTLAEALEPRRRRALDRVDRADAPHRRVARVGATRW